MSIESRVKLVEELYKKLDLEIAKFQTQTKIGCIAGCGKCCTTPDIDASPLEFLPWAFHLFLNGEAKNVLDELTKKQDFLCHIYQPLSPLDISSGRCGDYQYRGLICRLFGYGAAKDKYGELRLATCKIIKEGQKENFDKSTAAINKGLPVPIFTDYYMNLSQIDFRMGNIIVPVNTALKLALEEVLQYYAYRPYPDNYKGEKP